MERTRTRNALALLTTAQGLHTVSLCSMDAAGVITSSPVSYRGSDINAALDEQLRLRKLHDCVARSMTAVQS